MFQIQLFQEPHLYIVPKYGKKYMMGQQPWYLLTVEEWLKEGFIIRDDGKPQAWLFVEKKGWVGLYTSRFITPKLEPVFHVAAVQEMIDSLKQAIVDKKAEIQEQIKHRDLAKAKKNMSFKQQDIDFYTATLTFFVGRHIQAIDELKKLEAELAKLI